MPKVLILTASTEFTEDGIKLLGVFDGHTEKGREDLNTAKEIYRKSRGTGEFLINVAWVNDLSLSSGGRTIY